MKQLLFLILSASALHGASPSWIDLVSPIITPAEKKIYLSLQPEARANFEENFWASKSITREEYYQRLQYVDAMFGSKKIGSGLNTDQGRVYLSLGPPSHVTHIASSRIFVPIEIWYYDTVPAIHLTTEVHLIFYQKNSLGLFKLYSPNLDTVRALLLPESATINMFGPNDTITEASIRQNLTTSPTEDEIVTAAVNVASGITYEANDTILGEITSPLYTLGKPQQTDVKSKFIVSRPKLDTLESPSPYGGSQVDMRLNVSAVRQINIQVLEGLVMVYQNEVHLHLPKVQPIEYTHRLDLLPGTYRVVFTVDDKTYAYALDVKDDAQASEIYRADAAGDVARRQTPFEFEGKQWDLNIEGRFAILAVPQPCTVTWIVRRGLEVRWRSTSEAQQVASVELPSSGYEPGVYQLEARLEGKAGGGSRTIDFSIGQEKRPAVSTTVVSFNANLAPALRYASIGHQWLLRGNLDQARQSLQASLNKGLTDAAQIELARVDALAGRLDSARDRLRIVLATQPKNFEGLSVMAYVETKFQDYGVAADFYRRALAVQDSPAIREALASLPSH
ncbi:MAG TPA: GWxTD domain-containing protein [Bryobacteraceae bacterium]|nr:GWxTD domain-containing protein [Bryobacteraceae bacterium]